MSRSITPIEFLNDCDDAIKSIRNVAYKIHRVDLGEDEKEQALKKLSDTHDAIIQLQNAFLKPNHRVSYNEAYFSHQHRNSHMISEE
jgi:hypothetical protein